MGLRAIGVGMLLACFVVPTGAEPSTAVSYLMNDSISMLDWGLFRAEERLKSLGSSIQGFKPIDATANYNWDRNRIVVGVFTLQEAPDNEAAKSWAKTIVNEIRTRLMISTTSGKPLLDRSVLYSLFSHTGFQRKNEPEGMAQELDTITELDVVVMIAGTGYKSVVCTAPLLGTEVYFSEPTD